MSDTLRRTLAAAAAALLATVVGAIAAPGPAHAGGWAATVLEPMPAQLTVNQTYTVGMWVLQHGFHPYEGTLDQVGLRLVDKGGKESRFAAVKLTDPAHYAVSVVLPNEGPFTVIGDQGWFAPYRVGTISAKGGLRQLPTVTPLTAEHLAQYWPGAVKPPVLPVDETRDPFVTTDSGALPAAPVAAAVEPVAVEPVASSTPSGPGPSPRLAVLAAVAALVVAGTVLIGRRRRRAA
ncbi:hypothetical protein DFJ67_0489 [Asanoa ferruginea]|uniref:LPXTG-motif cell wall-anchored protein n=1 Tax=Asanoa ferruginea TaxID=53367 RepID=A0A3D9ZB49_9ACTN|nr:hypothetical protein [Asanoa ferruginea]REF94551.1 hypothetical protein DFJ67_0489 [Asanoa ferruginea]GIF51563.1 hypothetical protein Afe04nite_61020 [Asanoa ferruginea]